jgi:hypothetical protein
MVLPTEGLLSLPSETVCFSVRYDQEAQPETLTLQLSRMRRTSLLDQPKVKCFEPFEECNLCRASFLDVAVSATQIVEVDVLEAAWFLGVSNEPQWKLVRTVTIAAND